MQKIVLLVLLLSQLVFPVYAFELEMDKSQIQAKIERKFPLEKNKGPFWIKLTNPTALLDETNNKIGLLADMKFQLWRGERNGKITFFGQPVYYPELGQVYLEQITISHFEVESAQKDEMYLLKKLLNKALKKKLKQVKLYTLKEDRLKDQFLKAWLQSIRVAQDKVVMVLGLSQEKGE